MRLLPLLFLLMSSQSNSSFTLQTDEHYKKTIGLKPSHKNCLTAKGTNKNVMIISGSELSARTLTCPINCSELGRKLVYFKFGSKTINAGGVDWKLVEPWRISKSGNQLEFPKTVPPSLGGQYSCHVGDTEFKFNVTVVSLPHFDDSSKPPSKVVAIEGSPLSFSCKAKYLNIDSVSINPVILSNQVSDDALWTPISLNRFSSHVGLTHENEIKITQTDEVGGKRLTVSVASVPGEQVMRKGNFTHRFVCRVTISETDAEKFGMQQYSVEAATDVFYLPRPKSSDFSLSVKGNDCRKSDKALCTAADGAEFSVKLNSSFLINLSNIEAHIRMKFRIDNNLLSDLDPLFESGFLDVTKNETNGTMKLKITALPRGKLRDKFMKMKILRPIFEFHYSHAFPEFHADCRHDSICFYSTEIDKNGRLKDLHFVLNVGEQNFLIANPILFIIGIGCLIALVLLTILIFIIKYATKKDDAVAGKQENTKMKELEVYKLQEELGTVLYRESQLPNNDDVYDIEEIARKSEMEVYVV